MTLKSRPWAYLALGVLIFILIQPTFSIRKSKNLNEKNDATGKSSLAFVFDITGSMFDDLVQVRDGAAKIFKTVMAQREKLIYNYIMVPFHDPHLGDIINTTDSTYFMRQLGKVYVHGGGDCPEKTLTGIQKALEIALPSSFVYVFTDARSKDYHLEDEVLDLIQEKQSSVVFVMTGDCGNRTHPGFKTYERIAAASFGQVFHLEKSDVSTVLEYVRHAVKQKKVHLMYEARERGGSAVRTIPVDKHLSELTISLSGDKDDSDNLDISLRDPEGNHVDKKSYTNEGGTIDLKNVKLIRLKDPVPGPWQILTNSRLKHTIRVFGHGSVDFKYGFASRPLDKIELARPRPVLNQNTYLLVNMTGLIPSGTVSDISLVDYHGNVLYSNVASPERSNPHIFFVGPFIPPRGLFFVQVTGVDEEDYEFKRIAPTAIGSVVVGGPRAFMAPYHQAFVGSVMNLTCTVESASPFTLYWVRGNDEQIAGPLFYHMTDTAVWTIPELSLKDSGEYKCKVISSNGNHTVSTRIEPRESPPQIIGARNESVPIGAPAFLHCPAQSAGPVEIRWIRHGATVFTGANTERNNLNGTLRIHAVTRSDAGAYECQARNAGGMSSITVRLDIMEPPQAKVNPQKFYFNPNDEINIACMGIGEPKPELHWFRKGNRLVTDAKYILGQNSKTLKIQDSNYYDEGQYECRAMSAAGNDVDIAEVILAVTPKVELSQSKTMIGRGDSISFECKVTQGKPYPKVRWLRNGKELLIHNEKYIQIDGGNLHISGAQDSDAGSYSCVAENMAGRDIAVVHLSIGRMPSIVPSAETVRVNIERQITLQCLAIGFPNPEIEWQKGGISIDFLNNSRYTKLADGNLLITDAQVEDQDRFTCIAKNVYGQQSQTKMVMVTGLVSPVLGHVPPEEQLIEGEDLHLSCIVVLGTPRPNIIWLKDGQQVEQSSSLIIEGGGTSLLLRGGNPKDEGQYTCVAASPAGNATLNINVQLIKKPEFVTLFNTSEKPTVPGIDKLHVATVNSTHDVLDGEGFAIPCVVSGQPTPTVMWYLDGRPIAANSKDFVILMDNTLVVKKADKSYGGVYICQATNSAGDNEEQTTIRIMNEPVISPGQTSYNMVVGQPIVIPCDVFGEPKPQISWFLDDKPFENGFVNEDGSLTIDELSENHRGTFTCYAQNAAGSDTRKVTLTVHTTPHINADNQDRNVLSNESIVLECPAQALPPPTRIWLYEGEVLDSQFIEHTIREDGALVLHNVKVENTGIFTCQVSNLAGEDSLVYTVTVNEKPKIISETPGTIDVVKGLTIEIPCRATGIPEVARIWQKDGLNLDPELGNFSVDNLGTLRIYNATKKDAGNYNCVVKNQVGSVKAVTNVVVQEPPVILPITNTNYTAVIGDRVELRCYVEAHPPAQIQWFRRGIAVGVGTKGLKFEEDGVLVIEEATLEDGTIYTCKASNPAGKTETNLQVTVIAAPDIPNQNIVAQESVRENHPFSLYCPVFSTPLPKITWYINDQPMVEDASKFTLSEDKRKLHVFYAKIKDSGIYKCVARNAAGEGSKSFQVEVIVPLNFDESKHKKKLSVKEGEEVTFGCPVSGYPEPSINWIIDGQLLKNGEEYEGVVVSKDGKTLYIAEAGLKQEGIYHCLAQSKFNSLDVDVELSVLAKPRLGKDEAVDIGIGKSITLSCDVLTETDEKTTFVWSMNGSETLPPNVQQPMNGQRIYIVDSTPSNTGDYKCRVTNSAGKGEKTVKLQVLEPPEFVEKDFSQNHNLVPGKPIIVSCIATGNPTPTVEWKKDGNLVSDLIFDEGYLRIEKMNEKSAQITCVVSNKAGTISRDFFIQNVLPPKLTELTSGEPTFREGETIILDCPVVQGELDIVWMKEGAPIEDKEVFFSIDNKRLTIFNARRDHEDVYTCVAANSAGQVTKDFNVAVHSSPKIAGSVVLSVEANEGDEVSLNCEGEGNPKTIVHWEFNHNQLNPSAQLVNENQTVVLKNAEVSDSGVYKCYHTNVVGSAVKTISVVIRTKPKFVTSGDTIDLKVNITKSATLECEIENDDGVEIQWSAHGVPLLAASEAIQFLSGGRYLHIPSVSNADDGTYSCTVSNPAGTISRNFRLHVQTPPLIKTVGGEHTVIENNSLVLPCEVNGRPKPYIVWTKDGKLLGNLSSVQVLSEGQQFKITHAEAKHKGSYVCKAENGVGSAEISFDVDIITRPSITKGIKDVVKVVQGEIANFKCPIADINFKGQIMWLYNFQPIEKSKRVIVSQGGRKLSLHNSTLSDEGPYSCRIKNDAGETKFDYKLQVLVPPEIVMLEKDKSRTIVEDSLVTLSCLATGAPEPDILWYKDGEVISSNNVQTILPSGVLNGNELKIMRVKEVDSGKYTCEATNAAGVAEQEINLNVQTVPKIVRDGIPSDYDGLRDQRITISCPVYAKPSATVTWLKAGKPLSFNSNVKTSANGQKLYFLKLNKEDSDRYTCVAKNSAGEAKRDFNLKTLVAPSFDQPNIVRRITSNAGKSSVLNCPANGSPPPTITWLKDGLPLGENKRFVLFNGGRQLQISSTQGEDQGRYTCIATNSVGSDDLENTLNVIVPPEIIGKLHQNISVTEGFASELECDTNSTGIEVEWQKNGKSISPETLRGDQYLQVPSSGKRLSFLSSRNEDSGRYTCIIRNPAGESRKTFEFTVNVPPLINDDMSSSPIQTIIPGNSVDINCIATGSPSPQIKWLRNGEEIDFYDERYEFSNNGESIRILKTDEEIIGKYTCAVNNVAGDVSKDFLIRITAPPKFVRDKESVELKIDETIILTCNAESVTPVTVSWSFKRKQISNANETDQYTTDQKTLNLTKVTINAEGIYVCTAKNEAGSVSKEFEITVIEPPVFFDTQLDFPIVLGNSVSLDCAASGKPEPNIFWMKDNHRIDENDDRLIGKIVLRIEKIRESEAGRYTCIAENKAGRVEKDMILSILKPPKLSKNRDYVEVIEKDAITLQCPIKDTNVEISWLKNGAQIPSSDRVQLSISKDKLYILNSEVSDSAQYTCHVKNLAGEDDAIFDVTVNTLPKIDGESFNTLEAISNKSFTIKCDASGTPAPEISWYLDGTPLLTNDNIEILNYGKSIVLKNLQPNDEGRYTCQARNKVGKAEQDSYLEISVPPTVVMPSEEMKIVAGRQATIRCEVFGDPEPKVRWLKNGENFTSDLLQFSNKLSYLHLREVDIKDLGRYTCIATNVAGEHRASTVVQVLIPPSIVDEERVLQAKENTTFTIQCLATGSPSPTYTWRKNGKEIDGEKSTFLRLSQLQSSDDGRYTCTAKNEAGSATVDYILDVLVPPKFNKIENDIKVIEGKNARLECKVDGHPKPTIKWYKGGRPLSNAANKIVSPRGDSLMILKTRRADGGPYSCTAKNMAGESTVNFNVDIMTMPFIEDQIDQNPKVVAGALLKLHCPVRGNPQPKIKWLKENEELIVEDRYELENKQDLVVKNAQSEDIGTYTCHASNEAGELATNYVAEVIAKPTFVRQGENIYEAIEEDRVTMDCGVTTKPLPEIIWFRGEKPLYLSENFELSSDAMKLTVKNVALTNGGKYTCRASNEAGSADIDLILKVLVPPKIDKSNIIGNPLAIVNRNIYLECPVFGIPQPSVLWYKDGKPVDTTNSRVVFAHNNETFGIEGVQGSDQGRYTCIALNKGGKVAHDFSLDVLSPPEFEVNDTKLTTRREGDSITLLCPIKMPDDVADKVMDVTWTKDSRPIETLGLENIKLSQNGRKLVIKSAEMSNAGLYSCIALNRAGETSLEFKVEILSPPVIDSSISDLLPQVTLNQPTMMYCPVSGHPFPIIKWLKDGKPVHVSENIRFIDGGQTLQITRAGVEHAGKWSCVAENDAGVEELEMTLDVFTPPVVYVTSENAVKAIGQTITLICNATGNPLPTLKWSKGGKLIVDSPGEARTTIKGGRLDILHLKKTDVGDYTCQAINEAGSAEQSISVDVLVPPEIEKDGIDTSPRLPAGQALKLRCLAYGKPEPTVRWLLNDTEVSETTEGFTISSDAKSIQINNVTLADKGVYTCISENVAGTDKLVYSVDVVQAPIISNGGTQQVIEGELAIIECLVKGHPTPQVSWLRNGIRVETGVQGVRYLAEENKLRVIEARSSDSGIYVCVATNEAGAAQQAYTLEVLVSPKIASAPTTITPLSGSQFTLPCSARGYPDPVISWTFNGKALNPEDGYTIGKDGSLTIEKAEKKNSIYTCTAKNDAGSNTVDYKVQTINAPIISNNIDRNVNGSEGEKITIYCHIEGSDYNITWTKNNIPLVITSNIELSADKKNLSIFSTRLADQGEYGCTASNQAGNATQKTILNVGVPPKIIERSKTQVVNNGEQVTLWCEASGVPQPNIEWYKDNVLLSTTAISETSNTKKKAAMFSSINQNNAGVYTCKVENWAGSVEEDVDLIVMVPPEVVPEKMNVSTNPRQTVFLSCNSTGIPEPVISWMKDPKIAIQASEKYQILGTTLAIRNVLPEDDGFYYCIAKSDAGQKIATRKLIVNKPSDKPTPLWVECDENGKPKKTEYMIDRGDSPDDNPQLLPWKDVEDDSLDNSITYRCMPGPRSARTVILHSAPTFIVKPKNHTAAIGATVELKCSATGPPAPIITWAKNGRMIDLKLNKPQFTYSNLKIRLNNSSDAGNYTCFAQNSVGINTAEVKITIDSFPNKYNPPSVERSISVLTCFDRNVVYNRGVTWEFRGVPLPKNLAGIHFMNNGSLVIFDTALKQGDIELYTCKVRNRRRHTVFQIKNEIDESPEVSTDHEKNADVGDSVVLNCNVTGNPFTTNVIWTKNNQKLIEDNVLHVLPNNSLVLLSVEKYDEGTYRCVASNSIGKAYDDVRLIINENYDGSAEHPTEINEKHNDELLLLKTSTTSKPLIKTTPTTVLSSTPPASDVLAFKKRLLSVDEKAYEIGAEPTTEDILYERPSELVAEYATNIIEDCMTGIINDQGECVEHDGTTRKLKILTTNDNCPDGYSWNTRSGVCEDIDECAFDQPCDYECSNFDGGYECACPSGYDLTEDGCFDVNECETVNCDESRACFNTLGGFKCINDPCPDNFTLVDNRYCEPDCDSCGMLPITVHMLAIPSGLPITHIATLTAYDKSGRVLNDTTYSISETYEGLNLGRTRSGPFTIKAVKGGHAQVWTNRMLQPGKNHKVRVRAHSEQRADELHTPKETNFLVMIDVGQFPF